MITLLENNSKVLISRKGAYVESLIINGINILKETNDNIEPHGGLSILIPYADIVSKATYKFNGKQYLLPKNAGYEGDLINSMHGLTLDQTWKVITKSDKKIDFQVILNENFYPSKLLIDVIYMIDNAKFSVDYSIKNIGDKSCPIMCGAHPYFIFSDYWKFEFHDAAVQLKRYNTKSITTQRITDTISNVPNKLYDNAYFGGGIVDFYTKYLKMEIIRYNMPFFEIYNGTYAGQNSVAFEPLTGAPNCFNNGMGLKTLKQNDKFECGFSCSLL
ncbi:aldose 1-epimerase [Ferroplasma acidarmanus]|uniref:Aldose 1-epimerase n=1 Tax=Ferroplasma acidarmanus Fer1 TaxID=333146 RepID=S0AMQ4_FERAC|nr:aldose 1-epimerase [Ferroplasma acidarmanus]AGO60563.1 hypothetical protein FACI_IFERC00001G0583 [Ferroplasma acidarmanus Fer1]